MTATLTRALADLLACTYLDAVPTEAESDVRRAVAVAARVEMDALRAREAALTAEAERLRAEVEVERVGNVWRKMAGDATDLAQDIADEAFGPFETQGPIESLRAIERGIAGLNEDLAATRADAANARQIATEACDGWSAAERAHADTVEGEGYEFDRAGAEKPIATLRARLASPEPGADGAKET